MLGFDGFPNKNRSAQSNGVDSVVKKLNVCLLILRTSLKDTPRSHSLKEDLRNNFHNLGSQAIILT